MTASAFPPNTERPKGKCPICGNGRDAHYKPFCSKRCADVDLSRWIRGSYAIAGGHSDADDDSDDTAAARGKATPGMSEDEPNEDV